MHEVFKIKNTEPIPKILQKPLQFEKSQKFSKNPQFLGQNI